MNFSSEKIDEMFFNQGILYIFSKGKIKKIKKKDNLATEVTFLKSDVIKMEKKHDYLYFLTRNGFFYKYSFNKNTIEKIMMGISTFALRKNDILVAKDKYLYGVNKKDQKILFYNSFEQSITNMVLYNEHLVVLSNSILYMSPSDSLKNFTHINIFGTDKILSLKSIIGKLIVETNNYIMTSDLYCVRNVILKEMNFSNFFLSNRYIFVVDIKTKVYDIFTTEKIGELHIAGTNMCYNTETNVLYLFNNIFYKFLIEDDKIFERYINIKKFDLALKIDKKKTYFELFKEFINLGKFEKAITNLAFSGAKVSFNRKLTISKNKNIEITVNNEIYTFDKKIIIKYIEERALNCLKDVDSVAFYYLKTKNYTKLKRLFSHLTDNNYKKPIKMLKNLDFKQQDREVQSVLMDYFYSFDRFKYIELLFANVSKEKALSLLIGLLKKSNKSQKDIILLKSYKFLEMPSKKLVNYFYSFDKSNCFHQIIDKKNQSNIQYYLNKFSFQYVNLNLLLAFFEKESLKVGLAIYDSAIINLKGEKEKLDCFENVSNFIFYQKYKSVSSLDKEFFIHKK